MTPASTSIAMPEVTLSSDDDITVTSLLLLMMMRNLICFTLTKCKKQKTIDWCNAMQFNTYEHTTTVHCKNKSNGRVKTPAASTKTKARERYDNNYKKNKIKIARTATKTTTQESTNEKENY